MCLLGSIHETDTVEQIATEIREGTAELVEREQRLLVQSNRRARLVALRKHSADREKVLDSGS
jgi:hypothetical protein